MWLFLARFAFVLITIMIAGLVFGSQAVWPVVIGWVAGEAFGTLVEPPLKELIKLKRIK